VGKIITIRIPDELKNELSRISNEQDRPVSSPFTARGLASSKIQRFFSKTCNIL
jgi:predicted transcriptional regulator